MSKPNFDGESHLVRRQKRAAIDRVQEYLAWGQRILEKEIETGCDINTAIEEAGWQGSRFTAYHARQFADLMDRAPFALQTSVDAQKSLSLSWSHIVALLSVKSDELRGKLASWALKEGASVASLRSRIREDDQDRRMPKRRNSGRRFQFKLDTASVYRALADQLARPMRLLDRVLEQKEDAPPDLSDLDWKSLENLRQVLKEAINRAF
jgi:hypothetical protein